MMRYFTALAVAVGFALFMTGCSGGSRLIRGPEFFDVTNGILSSPECNLWLEIKDSRNKEEAEFVGIYSLKNPDAEMDLNLDAWGEYLRKKEELVPLTRSEMGMVWYAKCWINRHRYITLEATRLKGGNIRVTYREVLR